MTKMRWFFIVTLVGSLIFVSCNKNPTGPEVLSDNITIKSVTPNSGLTPGIVTAFVVNIEYELASKDSGEVNVGFNTAEVGRYAMITGAKSLIAKGSGVHQFNVSVVTQDWGGAGDFSVYVNLSENPHPASWTPLATDILVLTFK
ncbi:MAG: hypothetical protein MUP98_15550 [Candidatus Aminicenantes bacterium]|nr:hypothetical protein [Candidatus Aminicenantes bacterium]